MDYVKLEEPNVIDEENYKVYIENLQKSHQIEAMEYQHTPISMEQLHQAMQSSLNSSSIIHNFQLPLSPRQMSTLMLKTNFTRNFAEIPAHLPRNLDIDLGYSLANELPSNLRHDDILTQNLNRNIDISLVRTLGGEIDLQNGLAHTLIQNMTEDLRINDVNLPQNLRSELPHDLSHEIDLSHHLNRQNLEQEILQDERRTPMVIQCVPDSHLLEQNLQRIDQSIAQRLDQNLAQRLDQNIQRLEQNQRLDQSMTERLEQSVVQRLDQIGQRLDQAVVQRLDQIGQRLDQAAIQRLDHVVVHRSDHSVVQRSDHSVVQRLDQGGQRLDQRLLNGINERPNLSDHVLPMQFHIKSEQEDDSYFYENMNQGMLNVDGINGHIQAEHAQSTQPAIQTEIQMYSAYTHPSIPALNPIDLYSRTPNYPQNYVSRENPQNLVIHRQYDNASPYPEEFKKLRQDGVENGAKSKNEEPKENLKPSDQNKIYNNEFSNEKGEYTTKLTEELSMNIKGEYICYKCNEIFPSKRGLKQHAKSCIESDQSSEKVGKFGCSQCAYRCQSPAILKIHERTHSGEKPFSCNFCDYKSGQKNNVAKHILVHMKEKPFGCQYCDYRCAQKNNLVVHERTHTGYKPFACPYCDYRTVQKPNLVKHMYLHTDQKPFSCEMCSYRCVQKTNLTKHKQRHLNDKEVGKMVVKYQKPYRPRQKSVKCSYCTYRCVQKSSMDKHMQFKHAGLEFNGEGFDQGLNLMKNDEVVQNLSVKKVGVVNTAPVLNEPLEIQS